MIIRGEELPQSERGLRLYSLSSKEIAGNHFGVWRTTPETPFGPHKHAQRELWYIIAGSAMVSIDGVEQSVGPGDLLELPPWVEHGLRTSDQVTWICMG
ncbi:MAG: cupin domain-containing protein [Chloroflexota bacterium]